MNKSAHKIAAARVANAAFGKTPTKKKIRTKKKIDDAEDPLRGMGRAFAVLDFLASSPGRVVDVTKALKLPWATVHRTIVQLEKAQFLRRDPESHRYEIGPQCWHIGSSYLANHRVLRAAMPYLAGLQGEEGFAQQVVERMGLQSVNVYSHQRVDDDISHTQYGYHFPLHCGSKGLVLLAYEDPSFVAAYLKRDLERLTPETITDPVRLRAVLNAVRRDGMSLTIGDIQLFNGSIAAPIRDASGRTVACLSFVFRRALAKNAKRLELLTDKLLQISNSISIDLGWHPSKINYAHSS